MSENDSEKIPKKRVKEKTAEDKNNALETEVGGRQGPEPTRFGDWEKKGRCIDF